MTNQEAFDVMVRHLRKQGRKSVDENYQHCLYRGPEGLKCAVGALIPDEEYRTAWDEMGTVAVDIKRECLTLQGIEDGLLFDMQALHDHVLPTDWEPRFAEIGARYHLTLPPLESEASHA